MTTNQVIAEEQECFIYSMIAEEPETISMIDSTISDRVDINGTEPQEA
jgi:hypothetical protein